MHRRRVSTKGFWTWVVVAVAVFLFAMTAIFVIEAEARCQSDRCWDRVAVMRDTNSVEKKIDRITPYVCYGHESVKPCFYIAQESVTSGFWLAWNPTSCGGGHHARGLYQLCGWGEPWPVILRTASKRRLDRLKVKYETVKRKLTHHRIANRLGPSHWGF